MRSLNRLKWLHAFEAAARHGSFTGAAKELGVTPAAVGQLVRSLEDWVGHPLLHRTRSGKERLTLVDEARDALQDITAELDSLEQGLNKLRGARARAVVVITASQVLMMNWLMDEEAVIVCSPQLLNGVTEADWLSKQKLIYDDTPHPGVAVVCKALVQQLIDLGQLRQLFPQHKWPLSWAYFIVCSERSSRRPEVTLFHDWLVAETGATLK